LVTPFQQVHDQSHEPAFELAPIAAPHAFDFLSKVGGIDRRQFAQAQKPALLDRPGVESSS
jgi:hypothetical protein